MSTLDEALPIFTNKELFEKIHQAKNTFISLLENISNRIDINALNSTHLNHKGIKISKGNALERCPYQVLDVVRDFDPAYGLNIRLLNWWGYGMFLLILIGRNSFSQAKLKLLSGDLRSCGFIISETPSPFSYKDIIADYQEKKKLPVDLKIVWSSLNRLQLVKQLTFGIDFSQTEEKLYSEINQVLIVIQNHKRV
jgi:hypothetical protein